MLNMCNELNCSDVYRSLNYMGLLAAQCSFNFDKPQKNKTQSLNKQRLNGDRFWYNMKLHEVMTVRL